MKRFFKSILHALGYFGIYMGVQLWISNLYSIVVAIPVIVKYTLGDYDLSNPAVFTQYMDEILQPLLDATMLLTVISGVLTIGVICLVFVCRKKKLAKELNLRKLSGGTAVSLFMMGLGFNVLTTLLFAFLPEAWLASYEEAAASTFVGDFWLVAIGTAVMAPLVEELIFRGLIYTRLKKGMPMAAAVVITSVWFGLMHGHPLWIAYATVLGLIMVWIFERTKSLFGSILFHFGYNLFAVIGMTLPEELPDAAGIALMGVGVVVAAVGTWWFLRIPKAEEPGEETEAVEVPEEPAEGDSTTEAVAGAEETVEEVGKDRIEERNEDL